jgi:hypothetical protein
MAALDVNFFAVATIVSALSVTLLVKTFLFSQFSGNMQYENCGSMYLPVGVTCNWNDG